MSVTISGSGQIIKQVVQTAKTSGFTASGGSAWTAITGLSASITPTNASNKILVMVSIGSVGSNNDSAIGLFRGATQIFLGDAAGTRTQVSMGNFTLGGAIGESPAFMYLDSPATTSSTTYSVQAWILSGASFALNQQTSDSDLIYRFRSASSITLMEVAYA